MGSSPSAEAVSPAFRFAMLTSTSILLAYVNWRGLALVGKMSIVICVVAMSPFLVLIVVGSFRIDPSRWWTLPNTDPSAFDDDDFDTAGGLLPNLTLGGILWRPFLNNLFWNLNSFDSSACLVAELEPGASFLRANMLGLAMVASGYFLPLLVAIGSSESSRQSDWDDGYLAAINTEVGGPWLGAWTIFAAGISNVALFEAELSSDAYQLMGMADRGYVPKIFGERSQHGTPTYGILLSTVLVVVMSLAEIDQLIEMLNFNYAFALLMEYAAFFKLRVSRPDLERPYKIPLGTVGCAFFFSPTIAATLLVVSLATYPTYYFAIGTWIVGGLVYCAGAKQQLQQQRDAGGVVRNNNGGGDGYVHVVNDEPLHDHGHGDEEKELALSEMEPTMGEFS
mmetsp:Transcript_23116/g.49226  ORF Transcript_23116/g.49226 Transcript_23116/m.49226 type:complete len:395 (-) Transcript_23116:1409-2593(-)